MVDLSYVVTVKSTLEISQNFVAFSEYMNFKNRSIKISKVSGYSTLPLQFFILRLKKGNGRDLFQK